MKTQSMMSLLGGALVGAAAMYLLDPDMGSRRRKYVKQHAGEYLGDAGEMLQSGFETVAEGARDWGSTVAQKAQDYGHRLADHAQDIGSDVSETAGGWLEAIAAASGSAATWAKAADYVPSNRQICPRSEKGLQQRPLGKGQRHRQETSGIAFQASRSLRLYCRSR